MASAPDNDQICLHGASSIGDGRRWASPENDRLDVQAGALQSFTGLVDDPLCLVSEIRLDLIRLDDGG